MTSYSLPDMLIADRDKDLLDQFTAEADFWVWQSDEDHTITYLSSNFEKLTGFNPAGFVGRSRMSINSRNAAQDIWLAHKQNLDKRLAFKDFRYPVDKPGVYACWFDSSGTPQFDAEGRFLGYRGVARDVTKLVLQERAHSESLRERKLQGTLLEHIQRVSRIGAWRYQLDSRDIEWSDEIYKIYELPVQSKIDLETALAAYCPESRERLLEAMEDRIARGGSFDIVLKIVTPEGNHKWVRSIGVSEFLDGRPHSLFGTFQDVTDERERHLRMESLAKTDQLTDIANRRAFTGEMERRLKEHASTEDLTVLCLIDLDGFKKLNDLHGHETGDAVLKHVASELTKATGERGFVARLGGDEFAAIVDIGKTEDVHRTVCTMLASMNGDAELDGVQVSLEFSCGYAILGQHGATVASLMRHADLALYGSKSDELHNVTRFDAAMAESYHRRNIITGQFDQAITEGRIVPFYQPILELGSGRLSGLEALARWQRPDGSIAAPGGFLEVFDNPRLCVRLGEAMFERICADMGDWKARGIRFGRVGLNVTGADLQQPAFGLQVLETLSRHGLSPRELVIEITETTLLAHKSELVVHHLRQLRAAGVSIALDDFGTGYSSLTHLQNLDFDILKLDKSYVRDLVQSSSSQAIVGAMIGLGSSLGYSTVAEGIEDEECSRHLAALGCERGQGYHLCRPQSRQSIEGYLAKLARAA